MMCEDFTLLTNLIEKIEELDPTNEELILIDNAIDEMIKKENFIIPFHELLKIYLGNHGILLNDSEIEYFINYFKNIRKFLEENNNITVLEKVVWPLFELKNYIIYNFIDKENLEPKLKDFEKDLIEFIYLSFVKDNYKDDLEDDEDIEILIDNDEITVMKINGEYKYEIKNSNKHQKNRENKETKTDKETSDEEIYQQLDEFFSFFNDFFEDAFNKNYIENVNKSKFLEKYLDLLKDFDSNFQIKIF